MKRGVYTTDDYISVRHQGKKKRLHLVIAERVLGRPLPDEAEVHHVNGNKHDNRNRNLVICENRDYHQLLHMLDRLRKKGGRPFLDRWCCGCQRPVPLDGWTKAKTRLCRECIRLDGAKKNPANREYRMARYRRLKAAGMLMPSGALKAEFKASNLFEVRYR